MLRPFQHLGVRRSQTYGEPLSTGRAAGVVTVLAAVTAIFLYANSVDAQRKQAIMDRNKVLRKAHDEVYRSELKRGNDRLTRKHLRAMAQTLEEQGEGTQAEIYNELRDMFPYADREY